MDDDSPFHYTAEPSMDQMQLLAELRLLHDHFAGTLKTLPMQTCHNAMARINELSSKLDKVMTAVRECAGESSFDSGGSHGMYCSECGQYESTRKHLDNCWRRFAFEGPPK